MCGSSRMCDTKCFFFVLHCHSQNYIWFVKYKTNDFGEKTKIIIKLLQTQKKNDLKCKVFPSNKSGLVKCNVFWHTKKFLFFHAGFVWMIELVKKKCFVLSTRFPLSKTALFFAKVAFSVEKKKKGLKAKVVSVFCVIEPFNRL